jgi:RimJ/RimL family protein N-acetyltransferase
VTLTAPIIHTARLILRPHRAEDLEACAAMWSNPQVTRHIGGRPSSRTDTWMRILRYAGLWSILGYGYWALEDRATSKFVGDVGLADFHRELSPPIFGVPEAGWVLHPAFYGRGYATEALCATLRWADANLPSDKTACIIARDNIASIRVAEKAGYLEWARTTYLGAATILYIRSRQSPT